jgi:hypothetical protein
MNRTAPGSRRVRDLVSLSIGKKGTPMHESGAIVIGSGQGGVPLAVELARRSSNF